MERVSPPAVRVPGGKVKRTIIGLGLLVACTGALVTSQGGITLSSGSNTLKALHFQGYPGLGVYSPSSGVMFIGDETGEGLTCTDGSGCEIDSVRSVDGEPAMALDQEYIRIQDRACYEWSTSQTDASAAVGGQLCKTAASTYTLDGDFNPAGALQNLGGFSNQWENLGLKGQIIGSTTKILGEGNPTELGWWSSAPVTGSAVRIAWAAYATDGVDTQVTTGNAMVACHTKTTTTVCSLTAMHTDVAVASTGTLTCTDAVGNRGGSSYTAVFTLNCTSSLTQTTLNAYYRADFIHGAGWTTEE